MEGNWEIKESWFRRSKTFSVEVVHTPIPGIEACGVLPSNGWFIYAYICKEHPMFNRFNDDDRDINCAHSLEFHGGCTFRQHLYMKGELGCIKVGCDYRHYGDEYYEELSTKEDAASVFFDAEEIFKKLKAEEQPDA